LVAALALIIIFSLLVMREVIIVFLIILAPLAIISWIFPNNDKLWKLWWSSFSKLLLLYPIIVGALVTGRAFALMISDLGGAGIEGVFLSFAKLVAYIGPFFLIPTVFRYAGGAFANLAGIVNNRSKGVFDRQRKYRGEKAQRTKEDARAGNRFKNTPGLRRFNDSVGKGFAAKDAGLSALRRGGTASQFAKNTSAAAAEFGEKNADYSYIKADDEILAASLEDSESGVKSKLQNLERFAARDANGKIVKNADGSNKYDSKHDGEVNQYLQSIKAAKGGAGKTAYKKAAIQDLAKAGTYFRDAGHLAEMVNDAYGDDRSGAGAAMMAAKSASMSSGRVDIGGAGAGDTLGALGAHYDATKGLSKADNLASYADASEAASQRVLKGVVKSQGPQALAHSSMKPKAVKAVMPELKARLQEAHQRATDTSRPDYNPEAYKRELAAVANLYDTMSSTSQQNADVVAEELLGADLTGAGVNIQQQIEDSRPDPTFQKYRREYSRPEQDPNSRGRASNDPNNPAVPDPLTPYN
jgi:hypothetical protein